MTFMIPVGGRKSDGKLQIRCRDVVRYNTSNIGELENHIMERITWEKSNSSGRPFYTVKLRLYEEGLLVHLFLKQTSLFIYLPLYNPEYLTFSPGWVTTRGQPWRWPLYRMFWGASVTSALTTRNADVSRPWYSLSQVSWATECTTLLYLLHELLT